MTITIDGQIPEVRPGFTCTAEITTATKQQVVAVPIQSMTVRELLYDEKGNIIHEPRPPRPALPLRPAAGGTGAAPPSAELKPGQKREEREGVFLMKDGKAEFVGSEDRHCRRTLFRSDSAG